MNPKINLEAKKDRVDPENECIFNDSFWESLDFVVNAVDNVKARLHIDNLCVWYGKPLFESGTLGTKFNSQIILPKLTQSYGDSVDPPEDSIPLCTLKNFHNQIEHTIQWARDYFEGIMVEGPNETSKFVENPQIYINKISHELKGQPALLKGRLEIIKKIATAFEDFHYDKCIELARNMFQEIFDNQISQLLYCLSLDSKTDSGQPLWSGPKKPPVPIKFNTQDETHVDFIQSAANIFAYTFSLSYYFDREYIKNVSNSIQIQNYNPENSKIKINDKGMTEENILEDETMIENLKKKLSNFKPKCNNTSNQKMYLIEFEKDDSTNWHIDFVASVSNLRVYDKSDFLIQLHQRQSIKNKILHFNKQLNIYLQLIFQKINLKLIQK